MKTREQKGESEKFEYRKLIPDESALSGKNLKPPPSSKVPNLYCVIEKDQRIVQSVGGESDCIQKYKVQVQSCHTGNRLLD